MADTKNQTQRAIENNEAYCYARDNGHLDFVAKAEVCDRYFEGVQWDPAIRARLESRKKPIITMNKVLGTLAVVFGEQIMNRADIMFTPSHGGSAETAAALDKLWLHIASNNKLDWAETNVAVDGFIRSRGFYDVRMKFNDQMRGDVCIKHTNSKNVVIDPDAESYDPDDWKEVFVTKWLSLSDIEDEYGTDASKELGARGLDAFGMAYDTLDWMPDKFGAMHNTPYYGYAEADPLRRVYRVIERQYHVSKMVEWFVDPVTGDMREVPDYWDRNRIAHVVQQYALNVIKRKTQKIHWRTSCDNMLFFDAVSPYKHFTPVPFFPFFRHGRTMGLVENLTGVQDLLNKSLSQELHIVNTTANSGYKVKAGSLLNMSIEDLEERGGEDGIVIEVDSPDAIEKFKPNQVPTGLDRISYKADEGFKDVSMVSDSMRGFDRADVASKAIQAKQARGTVPLAMPFDNLAQTRTLLARNVLDLVQEYYTEERIINVIGRSVASKNEQVELNKVTPEGEIINDLTVGEYDIRVVSVPFRETFEQNQFTHAIELKNAGVPIPDSFLIENSMLQNKQQLIQALEGDEWQQQYNRRQQELELQIREAEAADKMAAAKNKEANAMLNMARAQQALNEAQGPTKNVVQQQKVLLDAMDKADKNDLAYRKQTNDFTTNTAKQRTDLLREQLKVTAQAAKPKPEGNSNGQRSS